MCRGFSFLALRRPPHPRDSPGLRRSSAWRTDAARERRAVPGHRPRRGGFAVLVQALLEGLGKNAGNKQGETRMEFTREVLDFMQRVRRRLREEAGVDIRLSQPDALNRMVDACAASPLDETRALGQRLSELSGIRAAAPMLSEAQLIEKYVQARYAGPLRG